MVVAGFGGATPDGAQGLLLILHSKMTLGGVQGTIYDARNQIRVSFMQRQVYPQYYLLQHSLWIQSCPNTLDAPLPLPLGAVLAGGQAHFHTYPILWVKGTADFEGTSDSATALGKQLAEEAGAGSEKSLTRGWLWP